MRAYEVSQPYNRLLQVHDFIYIGNMNVAFYKVIGCNNKFVALQDQYGRSLNNITELVVNESHKTPLYKQAMDMQMGRRPKAVTQSRKILRLKQIELDYKLGYKFNFYIARI